MDTLCHRREVTLDTCVIGERSRWTHVSSECDTTCNIVTEEQWCRTAMQHGSMSQWTHFYSESDATCNSIIEERYSSQGCHCRTVTKGNNSSESNTSAIVSVVIRQMCKIQQHIREIPRIWSLTLPSLLQSYAILSHVVKTDFFYRLHFLGYILR